MLEGGDDEKKITALGTCALVLAGCSTFEVYEEGDTAAQKGIPFYVKVPLFSQDTQLGERTGRRVNCKGPRG